MNSIIITGRIGKDPELKTAQNGTEYLNFSVAVSRRKKKGDEHPRTDWFECAAFGQSAVFISTYFKKGDGIEIRGRMENEPYEDKDSGKKRQSWKLMVDAVEFPKGAGKSESGQNSQDAAPTSGFVPLDGEEIPF